MVPDKVVLAAEGTRAPRRVAGVRALAEVHAVVVHLQIVRPRVLWARENQRIRTRERGARKQRTHSNRSPGRDTESAWWCLVCVSSWGAGL